jgi:FixJ family two-component response regulator
MTLESREVMNAEEPVVFVIDDNLAVRKAIIGLLRSIGLRFESFASAQEFLRAPLGGRGGLLLVRELDEGGASANSSNGT